MKLHTLDRKVHYWVSVVAAGPLLVVVATGLLLQLKKELAWVQPTERRGAGGEPSMALSGILDACRNAPEAEIRDWSDVSRIDVRPSRGLIKVTASNNWEVQLDAATGRVLQVAYRRSDIIESIHDGSWFHPWAKIGVFLPAAALLLVLLITGVYLFWLPIVIRRYRRKRTP